MKHFTTVAVVLAVNYSLFAEAQTNCQNQPKRGLCGELETRVLNITSGCNSQTVSIAPAEPCCAVRAASNDPCRPPDLSERQCRNIELTAPACDAAGECLSMSLVLDITTQSSDEKCCKTCACYGDPHCESFNSVIDTWMLCDARERQGSKGCPNTKRQCLKETDHLGRQCVWTEPRAGQKWSIGLQGSQCVFDMSIPDLLPNMTMYQADDFKMMLRLGERGIISQVRINSNNGLFTMTSDDCFSAYADLENGNLQANPWRNAAGVVDPSANYLPRSWLVTRFSGGDILWAIRNLRSGISANIRCTRTFEKVGAVVKQGPPRLNIEEIIEPAEPAERKNADGFCVTDKIDRMKSTTHQSDELGSACDTNGQTELEIARIICSKGVTEAGLAECRKSWCQANRRDGVDACLLDLGRVGWPRLWCAANVLSSGAVAQCFSGDCSVCVNDINDFGWVAAYSRWKDYWKGTGTTEDPECLTVDTLPNEGLLCQKGINIQTEESLGVWKTVKVIPDGAVLCGGSLRFDSISFPDIFRKRIRIQQCTVPYFCLSESCDSETGFSASFHFISENEITEDLVTLLDNGDLICNKDKNPAWENDKTGCLQQFPEKRCPCKAEAPTTTTPPAFA